MRQVYILDSDFEERARDNYGVLDANPEWAASPNFEGRNFAKKGQRSTEEQHYGGQDNSTGSQKFYRT
jgi:hypothetical protein